MSGTNASGTGSKPEFPDKQYSSNRVIQINTEMQFENKEKRVRKNKKTKGKKAAKEDKSNYETDIHLWDNDRIFQHYETDPKMGLDTKTYNRFRQQYGPNELTPPPSLPWYVKLLLSIFGGFFNQLLWVGSILCFIAYGVDPNDPKDLTNLYLGVVLSVVVTLTGIFGYYQEAKSDDIMEGFKNLAPENVNAFRNGEQVIVEPRDLVPGDIIEVRYGMKLPADVRIIECSKDMEVDNASLTGEAEPQGRKWVKHDDPTLLPIESANLCFFGTNLLKGTGKGMVFKTGDNTLMGSIAQMAADTGASETPIAIEIHDFVKKISAIAFALGISFFIVGYMKTEQLLRNVIFLIGIIVANVPEGLLATVTVSLTLTARRMAMKKVRVKNLESVETLGSTSVICSDKTGTLTTSIMTCADVVFDMSRRKCDTADPEQASAGDFYDSKGNQLASFKRLLRCGVLNNNSTVITTDTGRTKYTSDPTEQAIFKFCRGNLGKMLPIPGQNATDIREKHYPKTADIPFNSKNKWQVSVHTISTDSACFEGESVGDSVVEIKGAPERILNMCSSYCYEGKEYELDEESKNQIRALNKELAQAGERVLGFADLLCSGKEYPQSVREPDFNQDAMQVDGVAIPSKTSGGGITIMYEGQELSLDVSDCVNEITGEKFENFGKTSISALKKLISEQINVSAAQQRLFCYQYSKENGELDDDSYSFNDCQIPAGAYIVVATGRYRFNGTSAKDANWPMGGFRFLGFYAMIDPPRPSVPDAVLKCQAAGIKVVMVTGDHPTTAEAIAKQVNIIPQYETDPDKPESLRKVEIGRWTQVGQPPELPDQQHFSGMVCAGGKLKEELDRGQEDPDYECNFWNQVLSQRRFCVFARTSPRQKLLIVQACQHRGGIVAVTGDGVNDSPALKKADIGVAMGITGTEVAKDAADMILLDDNFASIVNGVEEGRIIFDNLKKSIAYTLSSNIPEIAPFLLYQTTGIPLPLTTVMILLVDLGTDLAPAISLAHEGKEADIMQRPPRDPERDNLVTWRLISFSYLQIGILQAIAGFYAYFTVLFEWGLEPGHLFGMDTDAVFGPTQDDKIKDNAYFLWCFDDTDLPCVYTPNEFDCDWINWDSDLSVWDEFKSGENWGLDSSLPYSAAWDSTESCNTGTWGTHSYADVGKLLFSSMVCQWGGGDPVNDCTYTIGTDSVMYVSKGTQDGKAQLHTSDRYDQRYCSENDFDGDKFVEPTIQHSAVWALLDRWDGDANFGNGQLCNKNGEALTMGKGFPASIYPFQMLDRTEALARSNTAYFISIIVVQWADLMICKTRSRSLFEQGMTNVFMNWSLFFETVLGAFLCYVPFANQVTGTRPIDFCWWTPAVPFSLAIYMYDELRKGIIRAYPNGWLRYNTYW